MYLIVSQGQALLGNSDLVNCLSYCQALLENGRKIREIGSEKARNENVSFSGEESLLPASGRDFAQNLSMDPREGILQRLHM